MTHPTEAAKAAAAVQDVIKRIDECSFGLEYDQIRDMLVPIIQASNEAYAAARTRELVEALGAFLHPDGLSSLNLPRNMERARALLATRQPTKEA